MLQPTESLPIAALSVEHDGYTAERLAPNQGRSVPKAIFPRYRGNRSPHGKPRLPRSELHGVMLLLFGPAAWKAAPAVLGVGTIRCRQLMVKGRGEPTEEQLASLQRWSRRLPSMLDAWHAETLAELRAEYEARRLEIAVGATALKQLTLKRRTVKEEKRREVKQRQAARRARAEADRPRAPREGVLIREDQLRPEDMP